MALVSAKAQFDDFYAERFLHPHFASVGEGTRFTNPWHVEVFGPSVYIGKHVHISATSDLKVRLSVWSAKPGLGRVRIGDYSVINPGARIASTCDIDIGNNALFATNVYITDGDSHDPYDRVFNSGKYAPVKIEDNVWLGERVIVCKGVTIGKNSVVGAGAVVVRDIPSHCVAVGNPARPVRELDPNASFVSRQRALQENSGYLDGLRALEKEMFRDNTLRGWLRYLLAPRRGD
ncbi:MAG TPA: DapH/DapD/GlmU-related protein [Polyangiales bacterium]